MPLPDGITTITLTGSYAAPDGTPLGGQVSFVPSSPLTDATGMLVIAETPLVARLQAGTGSFSIVLACTDNADLLPEGWQWRAIIQVPGVQASFYFDLPSTLGDTQDISALTPHPGAPAASGSYVSSINGQTGDVELADGFGILPPAGDLGAGTTLSPQVTSTHLAAPLPIAQGGTGAASGSAALAALGGISAASPAFTGTPTAPTASALTDSTQVATTAYADTAVAAEASRATTAEGLKLAKASNLSDVASAGTARTNLGLGTAATLASSAVAQTASNLSDLASASTARTNLGLGTAATQASSAFDTAGAATAAQAAAIAASLPTLATAAASSAATLAVNTVTQVTAASNLTMTLPSPVAGALIVVERESASAGTVTVSGSIRGSAGTVVLSLASESEMFLGTASTWDPVAGHKTLGSLDGRYGQLAAKGNYTADQYFGSGRPWFDVCSAAFGADPTGVADSTLAIARAINTAMGLRTDTGVGMTASSTTVTDSSAVSGDAGLYVNSPNFPLGCSLISSVTPGVGYTVATAATATLSGQVCGIGTGSAVVARTATGPVFIPSGTYKVSSDLLVQSVSGFQLIGAGAGTTALRATGTGFTNAVLTIDGSLDGIFAGFVVQGDGTEGAGSSGIPMAIGLTWTTAAARSTSANTFRNLRIRNLNFVTGLNLAGVTTRQTDGTSVHDVVVAGGQVRGGWTTAARTDTGLCGTTSASATVTDAAAVTGDLLKPVSGPGIPSGATITAVSAGTGYTISANATATASGVTFSVGTSLWQQGFVFGNGTFGNDYDHQLYNCSVTRCYYGWYCNASGFGLWGAQPSSNGCDFYVIPNAQVTIENIQSQNAGQFLLGAAGSGIAPCSARDVSYSGFATPLAAAGTTWVSVLGAGGSESWVFESILNKTTYGSGSPVMAFNCSGGSTKEQVTLINVRQGASPSSGVTVTNGGSVIAVSYIDTSTTPNTAYPLWLANASVALNSGLTGATHASRWIGATTSGAPGSGTFSAGDFCVDQSGLIWVYTGSAWSSHTFTGGTLTSFVAPAVVTLTDASSIAVNAALGNDFRLTLTASGHTLASPTNPVDGQAIKVQVTQPASGGPFTLSYGTAYEFSTGLPSPALSIGASATDLLGFCYNAVKAKWLFLAFIPGFS